MYVDVFVCFCNSFLYNYLLSLHLLTFEIYYFYMMSKMNPILLINGLCFAFQRLTFELENNKDCQYI